MLFFIDKILQYQIYFVILHRETKNNLKHLKL